MDVCNTIWNIKSKKLRNYTFTAVFFLGALDSGVMFGDEHDGSSAKPYQLPTMSDMLICFPTQAGTYLYKC